MTGTQWERIAGQDRAVALLRHAVERLVHAYLLVGPRGSGIEEAARTFAAAIVAPDDDARSHDLVLRGVHPDVVEIDPPANQIRAEDAQAVLDESYRSPIEGARKVIVVWDAERMNETAANKLLKTLEEPPPSTVLVLVTAGADQLLPTIRSRCQRVDFAQLPTRVVADTLVGDGIALDRAELLAGLGGGRLDRARALDGRLGGLRCAFLDGAAALDGSGGAVALAVDGIQAALGDLLTELETRQSDELTELAGQLAAAGYPDRTARSQLRRVEERHRRAHRRARADALVEGITALETWYRDGLAQPGGELLNRDRPAPTTTPTAASEALTACRFARQSLAEHNPNEVLLLERLFLHLPPNG